MVVPSLPLSAERYHHITNPKYVLATEVDAKELILSGNMYNMSGKFDVCENNARSIEKLEAEYITRIDPTTLYELPNVEPRDPVIIDALFIMLEKGPKAVC
ncbi:unnamed protein product [Dibothriocephalus latus]|uniref:Uncharacterized protein n=1 Tax=Dibothriocephalus latus TaxID=60516 RepID=A0A3P6PHS5_DIBLA|nr:unnamed protein product [Dibothriocephalus latus]